MVVVVVVSPKTKSFEKIKNQAENTKNGVARRRAMPVFAVAGAHPGQGHICLATQDVVLLTRLGYHTSGWVGGIPGGAQVPQHVHLRVQ